MPEARKAATVEPRLDLYALAQVRAGELREKLGKHCDGCGGPEDLDSGCSTRPVRQGVFGRTDWPRCPLAMVQERAWQDCVDLYRGAQISPLSGFPEAFTAWAFDALVELKAAVQADEVRRIKEAQKTAGTSSHGARSGRGW